MYYYSQAVEYQEFIVVKDAMFNQNLCVVTMHSRRTNM